MNVDPKLAALVALIASAITGAVALIGVYLTNRSNTQRLKIQLDHDEKTKKLALLRERGEELYKLSHDWLNSLARHYLPLNRVMDGKLTYNQFLDLAIQSGKEHPVDFGRLEMLIDVYFPSAKSAFDHVIEARTQLNEIVKDHKFAYERGELDGRKFLQPFIQSQLAVETTGDVLKQEVIELIRVT